uniref:Zinc finger AN1-type containing 2A n=1 Tax=Chrysemys picta bellii TaxID=8478 RepID=A0A8C3I6M4_CHRPI
MEFPDLGKHCSEKTCKQLDFLPLKCDACKEVFCKDHITYDQHKCTSSYKKDVQVPVCPLCNTPIPVRRGEMPDIVVGAHMDRDCKYDPTQQKQRVRKLPLKSKLMLMETKYENPLHQIHGVENTVNGYELYST